LEKQRNGTLDERGLTDNTIFLFVSDHGCHFRTRNSENKRSPHQSSIHIPLLLQGPGLNEARMVRELMSMIDVTPRVARALRTDQWTYYVADPNLPGGKYPFSKNYVEYQMCHLAADPHQLVNLAGRHDVPSLVHYIGERVDTEVAAHLRQRLLARMAEAGEPPPKSNNAACTPNRVGQDRRQARTAQ
jgi:arylsulfatase A-like enzyme